MGKETKLNIMHERLIKKINYAAFSLILLLPVVMNPLGGGSISEIAKLIFASFVGAVLLGLFALMQTKKGAAVFLPDKKIIFLGLAWLGANLLSTVLSVAPIVSFWGNYNTPRGFVTATLIAIFFFLFFHHLRDKKQQTYFLYGVEIVGVICSLYAIYQFLTLDYSFAFGAGRLFAGRVYSFFSNPNDFGEYLIFPVFAALTNLFVSDRRKKIAKFIPVNFLHIGALLLFGVSLFLSLNRASILAVFVGLIVFLALYHKKHFKKIIVGTLAGLTLAVVLIFPITGSRSLESRFLLWQNSAQMMLQTPPWGFGNDTFNTIIQPVLSSKIYETENLMSLPNHPHNEIIALWLYGGIISVVIFAAMLFCLVQIFFKRLKKEKENTPDKILLIGSISTLTAVFVTAQFSYLQITHFILLLVPLVIILNHSKKAPSKNLRFPGKILSLFALFVAIFFVWFGFRMLSFETILGQALNNSILNPAQSVVDFEKLLQMKPPYAYPYDAAFTMQNTQLLRDTNLADHYESHLDEYGKITNRDYQYFDYKGLLEYARGNRDEARTDYQRALSAAPNSMRVLADFAIAANKTEDFVYARAAAEIFIKLVPEYVKKVDNEDDESGKAAAQNRSRFMKSNPVYFEIMKILWH
jgi:O-antigen ligase